MRCDPDELLSSLHTAERQAVDYLSQKMLAMEHLLEISCQISTLDLKTALNLILRHVLELSGAQRGFLMLGDNHEELRFELALNLEPEQLNSAEFAISRSITARAFASGQVIAVEDVPSSAHRAQSSIVALGLRALMAIPLKGRQRTLGVIYVDTDSAQHRISDRDPSIFIAFGSQAAIALENARLHKNLQDDYVLLERSLQEAWSFAGMHYRSRGMHRVRQLVERAAESDIAVLIQGETGTGKELVAQAIHAKSRRREGRFVGQNAGALADTLLESELFGHRRGSFSSAVENKTGLFEFADHGTVFLDEIGEASPALQVSLLRLLENGTFRRVGDIVERKADVRIIAATHRDLEAEAEAGSFRADLYYRLNVFPIALPPLRERREDIPLLVETFVDEYNRKLNRSVRALSKKTMDSLMQREWKGNVRELKNFVFRLMVLSPGDEFLAEELAQGPSSRKTPSNSAEESAPRTLEEVERDYIRYVLTYTGGNQTRAAAHLGLNRSTLRGRLRKLGLTP